MFGFITAVHVIVSIFLILVVLLQTGKGAEMGSAFGGASQTVFGSSGPAGFLNKLTTAVAIIFMVTSLLLSYFTGRIAIPTIMEEKAGQTGQATQPQPVPQEAGMPEPGQQAAPPQPLQSQAAQPAAEQPPAPVQAQGEPQPPGVAE